MALTSAQLAALATEISTDPTAIGYASHVTAGDDGGIATLLNTATATNIFRNDVGIHDVVSAIAPTDFAALTALQLSKLQVLFTGTTTLDATVANNRTIFLGIFTGMATTITNLTAVAQRKGTRAEILFGIGVIITSLDVAHALRGGS